MIHIGLGDLLVQILEITAEVRGNPKIRGFQEKHSENQVGNNQFIKDPVLLHLIDLFEPGLPPEGCILKQFKCGMGTGLGQGRGRSLGHLIQGLKLRFIHGKA